MNRLEDVAKVAVDDPLFIEYFRFKHGQSQHLSLVDKLFSHLKMPFVMAGCQYLRCEKDLPDGAKQSAAMKAQLLASGAPDKTEEQLAASSVYQLILTNDKAKTIFPYLNISQSNVELNYTKTCVPAQSRTSLLNHLKALCAGADKVVICDQYFFANWSDVISTKSLFTHILPRKALSIEFVGKGYGKSNRQADIEAIEPNWTLKTYSGSSYSHKSNHDRYLLIEKQDEKVEVILSSGFLYLWKPDKEISCIFRQL
ncbi:MAG: hypothetical protein ACI8WB_005668 [Phenylobacterium sp.]